MEAAAPYAVDEQMRVEALRAAASIVARTRTANSEEAKAATLHIADSFVEWLLK